MTAVPVTEFPEFVDDTYCGIYMIDSNGTSDEACTAINPSSTVNVKIGYSSKMKRRLDQYLLGSPVCLRVYGLIVVKKFNHTKMTRMMRNCEVHAHDLLRCNHLVKPIDRRHGHTLEWFRCTIRKLCDTFVRCMMYTNEYYNLKPYSTKTLHKPYFMFRTRPYAYMYKTTPLELYCKPKKSTPSKNKNNALIEKNHIQNKKVNKIVNLIMKDFTDPDAHENTDTDTDTDTEPVRRIWS